jgi:hypothetical protein
METDYQKLALDYVASADQRTGVPVRPPVVVVAAGPVGLAQRSARTLPLDDDNMLSSARAPSALLSARSRSGTDSDAPTPWSRSLDALEQEEGGRSQPERRRHRADDQDARRAIQTLLRLSQPDPGIDWRSRTRGKSFATAFCPTDRGSGSIRRFAAINPRCCTVSRQRVADRLSVRSRT